MYQGNTWVPVDDHCCWIFCYAWNPDRPLTDEERAQYAGGHGIFAEVDERYVPLRNRDNDYLISRERQRHSNFTGIEGISEQDAAIADSQGLIADQLFISPATVKRHITNIYGKLGVSRRTQAVAQA